MKREKAILQILKYQKFCSINSNACNSKKLLAEKKF